MKKTEVRRQLIIDKVADHLLAEGLKRASLRQLAGVTDMSDRMLMYYFTDKDELLRAALETIAQRLVGILATVDSEQMPFQALIPYLAGMMREPLIRPYLRLWLELMPLAVGEEEPYCSIARQILEIFYKWIVSALKVEQEEDRLPMAAFALALTEGLVLLNTLNYDSMVNTALKGVEIR